MAYWLDVFTAESWEEFKAAGGRVAGFPARKWPHVQKIQIGDRLLVYLQGFKLWVAVLKVVDEPFFSDEPPIWSARAYPARVGVQLAVGVDLLKGVPMGELLTHLPRFQGLRDRGYAGWGGFMMSPPTVWSDEDGMIIERAIRQAVDRA